MIAFIVSAAVMAAIALAWVVVPLLRGRRAGGVDRDSSNLAILRDQRKELESDLANGVVTSEQYDVAVAEIDRRVLEEARVSEPQRAATLPRSGKLTAVLIAIALPIAAAVMYVLVGTPAALSPELAQRQAAVASEDAHKVTPQELEGMVARLAERLGKEPDNGEGWSVLARSYSAMGKTQQAVDAYEHASKLLPDDAPLLADYADALALLQGRNLAGKPMQLIERALKANPTQWKALALAGTAAFDAKDYRKAAQYWERAQQSVPATSPFAQSIGESIAEARQLAGLPSAPATPPATATTAQASPSADAKGAMPPGHPPIGASGGSAPAAAAAGAAAGNASVAGTVSLAPALAKSAQPEDTLYIFARAAQGPRVPLALMRKQVKDLPVTFTLDDSMAMTPDMKLSGFPDVVVGARITKSGSAMPQSGDLETISPPLKVGTKGLALVIDRAVP